MVRTNGVSADRTVNIDETSCRLLPVLQIGWGRRGVKQAQLQGNTREATTFTVAGHAGGERAILQDRRSLAGAALAGARSPCYIGERLGHGDHDAAARGHIGQRAEPEQRRTSMDPSLGHGQHPRQRDHLGRHEGHVPHVVLCFIPPRSTSYLQPCDVAVFRSFQELHPGKQASTTLARSCPRRLVRRLGHEQSLATTVIGRMGGLRSHGPLQHEQGVDDWLASFVRPQRRRVPRGR